MGPSMAAGSHVWSPNWADFPVAARISPRRGRVRSSFWANTNSSDISRELNFIAMLARARNRPISPIRLRMTA